MVNQYTVLVALAVLLASGSIVVFVGIGGKTRKSLSIPPQARFEVIDREGQTCFFNWDTINGNYRFDCQDESGMLDVTLFTNVASDGSAAPQQIYHFEQADPRYSKNMGSPHNSMAPGEAESEASAFQREGADIPDFYDHGVAVVNGQAQSCEKEVLVGTMGSPTVGGFAYEGECCCTDEGKTLDSWSIAYGGEKFYFHALAGKLWRIGSSSACAIDGSKVVAEFPTTWQANAEIFRTPGSCNNPADPNFVDVEAMIDNIHLFVDGSSEDVEIGELQKGFAVPQATTAEVFAAQEPQAEGDRWFTTPTEEGAKEEEGAKGLELGRRLLEAKQFKSQNHVQQSSYWDDVGLFLSHKLPGTNWCGKGTYCQMAPGNNNKGCHGCNNPPYADGSGTPFCTNGWACPNNFRETADCCITDEYGYHRLHRPNPSTAADVSCRQHDKCQFSWGSKSSCMCDKHAYEGINDAGVSGNVGWQYNRGIPKLLFHPKNPLFGCRNWQRKCVQHNWIGLCTKHEYRWKTRKGIPFVFNKYNRGKDLRNGPLNYPIHRLDTAHGWCGGSPPTASPTPSPPTTSPTTRSPTTMPPNPPSVMPPIYGGGAPTPCFLYKENADGDVMTLLVDSETHKVVSKDKDMHTQVAAPNCNQGGPGPAPFVRR